MRSYVPGVLPHLVKIQAALLLLAALPASGQLLSVGVKAGVPLTSVYAGAGTRYIIGPTAEVHLPFHLGFEVDALYRGGSAAYSQSGNGIYLFPAGGGRINDWQVPFLAKYEGNAGPVRPFVDAGIAYRHVSGAENPNTAGFAAGGGITLKLLAIRISPEIRYGHWFSPAFRDFEHGFVSRTNQADFLLGITF